MTRECSPPAVVCRPVIGAGISRISLGLVIVTGGDFVEGDWPLVATDHPLPVLRLARLGVDTRAQGRGLGKALLRHVLVLAVNQRDRLGGIGVVTDTIASAVDG